MKKGPQDLEGPKNLRNNFETDEEKAVKYLVDQLEKDEEFCESSTYRAQCGRIFELFRKDTKVPYSKLALCFEPSVNKSSVQQQVNKFLTPPKDNGRPPMLTDDEDKEINAWVQECFSREFYPTYSEFADEVLKRFNKIATNSIINYFMCRHQYAGIVATPMEAARVNFDKEKVEEYLKIIPKLLACVRRGFLFNCDEAGQQDFVDTRPCYVICPNEHIDPKIPVERASRRLTVLHTIASDGEWIKPLFVVPRRSVDSDLYDTIPYESIDIKYQNKGFLNSEIFMHWFSKIFVPHLINKRKAKNYYGPALLILDGFSAHTKVTDSIPQDILDQLNLRVLYLPPHTSDQFQPLDLVIFGIQKLRYNRICRANEDKEPDVNEYDLTKQTKHIINVFRSLQQASDIGNVTSSFKAAGFINSEPVFNKITQQYEQYHLFCPEKATRMRLDYEKAYDKFIETEYELSFVALSYPYKQPETKRMKLDELKCVEENIPFIRELLQKARNESQ